MEFPLLSLLFGTISGLIASYLFLMFFLKRKRPKIDISPHISKIEIDGETNFLFKFINKTETEIFDIHIETMFYKPIGDVNRSNLRGKDIKLKDDFMAYIPAELIQDTHNLHAIRLRTTEDLISKWSDESSFIRLTIIAKHSLSGLNKVFFKDFLSKDCISTKKFLSGNNLNVK